jgi:uncharacterized membrane protein
MLRERVTPVGRSLFWIVVVLAVLAGLVFRLEHIRLRQFRLDETITALRVSGHTTADVRALFDGNVHSADEVLRYQRVDSTRPFAATVQGLAVDEPQITPLFFVVDRAWAAIAGSSIPALRFPAVIFGLGAIAAMFWLCFELTQNRFIGGIGAALMAVSPFFINYDGQARQYSVWTLLICVTSALLLRALRANRRRTWFWYAITMALAIYADPLSLCVLAAHFLYVVYRRNRAQMAAFGVATAIALLLFLPWALLILHGRSTVQGHFTWVNVALSWYSFVRAWVFNIAAVLFDAEWTNKWLFPIAIAVIALVAYGAYRLQRDDRSAAWFLGAMGLTITLPQLFLDFITHSHASTVARYLIPLWIALLVCTAILLGRGLTRDQTGLKASWFVAFCAVVAVAIASSAINSSHVVWWDNHDFPSVATGQVIASDSEPLVLMKYSGNPEILAMSHYVGEHASFLLFESTPNFPLPRARNTFVIAPPQNLISAVRAQRGYSLEPVKVPASWVPVLYRLSLRNVNP